MLQEPKHVDIHIHPKQNKSRFHLKRILIAERMKF